MQMTQIIEVVVALMFIYLSSDHFTESLPDGLLFERIDKWRPKRSTQQLADSFVEFTFTKEPEDIPSAVKDSTVRFDCVGGVSLNGKQRAGGERRGAIKIHWRKDGGPLDAPGRTGNGGRMSILQNGSLVINRVGSSAADADDGFYQCTAIVDDQWTFVSRKAKLALASLSRFEDQPADLNVPAGETVSLRCRIQSNPPARVTWYKDDVEIVPDKDRLTVVPKTGTLEIRHAQTKDQGAYKCKAENGDKNRFSKEGRLRVAKNPLLSESIEPKFATQPRGQVVKAGEMLVLECAASGQPEPDIRWTKDNKPIDILESKGHVKRIGQGTIIIEKVEAKDAGMYICHVNNTEDSLSSSASVEVQGNVNNTEDSLSSSASVEVQEAPAFLKTPKNIAAKETVDVEFECQAEGRPSPAVSWFKNGEPLLASEYFSIEGTKLKITGLVKTDQGVYQCVADNEAGSAQTAAQLLVEMAEVTHPEGSGSDVPTEPLGLKAVRVDSRSVTIKWDPPLQSKGDLKGYTVFYKQNGSDRERLINVSASAAREIIIGRLQPSTTFYFRVVAFNNNGVGLSSVPLIVQTTIEQGVPGPVRDFLGKALSSTSIELHWDPPNGEEAVSYYRIFYALHQGDAGTKADEQGGGWNGRQSDEDDDQLQDPEDNDETEIQVQSTSYILHGLEEYTKYQFRIEAVNNIGAGRSSDSVVIRTDEDVPSAPPTNVSAVSVAADSVLVRWAPPARRQRNGEITSYKIRYKFRDRGQRGHIISVEGTANQHTLSSLDRGETYIVRVAAVTSKGQGPFSSWVPVELGTTDTDEESQPPGAPTSLRLQARSNEVLVTWTPPLDDGLVIRGYLIGWGINMPDIHQDRVGANERYFTIKNLRPSREYVISLRAYNKLGNGFPIYETVRTLDAATPGPTRYLEPPMGLRAAGVSSSAIQLSWTWSDRDTPPDVRPVYAVKYNPTGGGGRYGKEINTTDTTLVVDGLKPDQQYEFTVKAVIGRLESPWSMTASTKSLAAAPSSYPRDLTIIPSTDSANSVIVTWQPPKHPNGKITHYLVYYSNDQNKPDNQWKIEQVRGDRMSGAIRNLFPDTDYYFKIQAFNERGYSPISPVKQYRVGSSTGARSGGGRQQQYTPNDDGKRKPGSEWNSLSGKQERLPPGYSAGGGGDQHMETTGVGGLSKQNILIIVGAGASAAVIAVILAAVYLCRRRYRARSASGYVAGKKTVGGTPGIVGADSKPPPDLWIHHDHSLELRNVGNPSIQDFKRRSPSPPPSELNGQSSPPRYHSLAAMPTSSGTLSRSYHHHQSSNSVDVPRPYPPAKAPPPQVVYTGPKVMNRDDSSSPYGSAGAVGVLTPTPPPQMAPPPRPPPDQTPRSGMLNPASTSGTPNPLKSFTALTSPPPPPPLGQTGSRTQLIRHVSPMVNQTPKSKPAGIVIGTKARQMQARPVHPPEASYCPTGKEETDNDLPRSYSTEELNTQMQNLDILMKDLNAISTNDFDV